MVEDCDEMPMLSGSRMELGDNAGALTWNNSKQYGATKPLLKTDNEREPQTRRLPDRRDREVTILEMHNDATVSAHNAVISASTSS
jgi:hypothetical protein